MKHLFLNVNNKIITIVEGSHIGLDTNLNVYVHSFDLFLDSDKCKYCGLTGLSKLLRLKSINFKSFLEQEMILHDNFPCLSDEEYLINKLLE